MAIARALRDELSFGAVSRRENPVAAHIPYSRHVSDEAIRTDDGMLMSFLHLSGFCFETADISDINARLLGRNDLIRFDKFGNGTWRFKTTRDKKRDLYPIPDQQLSKNPLLKQNPGY